MLVDDIWTMTALGFAGVVFGWILGMFALHNARGVAKQLNRPTPRFPGLSPEQTFGLAGILSAAALIGAFLH